MRKNTNQIPVFFILCSIIVAFSAFKVELKKYCIHTESVKKYFDVSIGNRTSDSTGSLSINNSGIQQSVISVIGLLSNRTITSENCSLLVGKRSAYLLFNVNDSANVKSSVAIELYESSSGSFTFNQGTGKALYLSTGGGACTSCIYKFEFGSITSSFCSANNTTPCKFFVHYKM